MKLSQALSGAKAPAGTPERLYRCLPEREYAEDFVRRGAIMLSTVASFANLPRNGRGDREGYTRYETGHIEGPGSDPLFRAMAAAAGIEISEDCAPGVIHSAIRETAQIQGLSLCLCGTVTPRHRELFGAHVVRIDRPYEFIIALSAAITEVPWAKVHGDWVTYVGREFRGTHLPPALHPLFLKPPDMAWQKEYRVAWLGKDPYRPLDPPRQPFVVHAPNAAAFCALED